MLSDISGEIKKTLNDTLDNKQLIDPILNFLTMYKKNQWIYPGVLIRKFKLTSATSYSILNRLADKNILESYYEMYCSHCQKSSGKVKVFNQLPSTFICDGCDEELPALENSVIIYKVLNDAR